MDWAGSATGLLTRRPTMVRARKRSTSAAAFASLETASPSSAKRCGSGTVFTTWSHSTRSSDVAASLATSMTHSTPPSFVGGTRL